MAFDGITIANIVKELNDTILNGRIAKIAQPENDELLLTIKPAKGQVRLVISASASREFDTLKSQKVLQSLEIGLFFCQIFIFII